MVTILLTRAPELDGSIISQGSKSFHSIVIFLKKYLRTCDLLEFQQYLKTIETELEGKSTSLPPKVAVKQCGLSNSSSPDDEKVPSGGEQMTGKYLII